MSESKYRIPRLAMAVMVLGACGDDGEGSNRGTTAGGNDGGTTTNRDAGTSTGRDAGASSGSDAGGGAGSASAADLSRLSKVGSTLCKLVLTCKEGDFAPLPGEQVSFKDEKECLTQFTAEFTPGMNKASPSCRDAFLTYYECYVGSGCAADMEKCAALYEMYYSACEDTPISG